MSAMVAGAIGNPESFEQSPQEIPSRQRDGDEGHAYCHMFAECGIKAKPREDNDLRADSENIAHGDIRYRFSQRHEAGLGHASNPKRLRA
jgi:hypothetical protein